MCAWILPERCAILNGRGRKGDAGFEKRWIIVATCVVLAVAIGTTVFFLTKTESQYKEEDILGKDVATIVETYGEFDRMNYEESGKAISSGWYILEKKQRVFFGDRTIRYFVIQFQDGTAVRTYEQTGTPGG